MRKWKVVGLIYGIKYSWKGHTVRNGYKNMNRSVQDRSVNVKAINRNIPTTWRWARGDSTTWSSLSADKLIRNRRSRFAADRYRPGERCRGIAYTRSRVCARTSRSRNNNDADLFCAWTVEVFDPTRRFQEQIIYLMKLINKHTYTHTHTRARSCTHTYVHTRTHARRRTNTYAHARTRGKTIAQILISSCFKPSQLQRITSGLRETFIKRYVVEATYKAEITLEEQSEEAESGREDLWIETKLKGPQRRNRTQEQNTKEWASSVALGLFNATARSLVRRQPWQADWCT